jgi:hypothetical protein
MACGEDPRISEWSTADTTCPPAPHHSIEATSADLTLSLISEVQSPGS